MRMKIVGKAGKFPSTRKPLDKSSVAQSLGGKPSVGEPAFPRSLNGYTRTWPGRKTGGAKSRKCEDLRLHRPASQREDVEHRARIGELQRNGPRPEPMRARRHCDVLLAIDRVADRRRHHAAAPVEAPNLLQGARIVGHKSTLPEAGEHEIAGGPGHARPIWPIGAGHGCA